MPVAVKRHPQRVFFNRVPKCGTHTLLDVITQLATLHNYTFARSPVYMTFHIDDAWKVCVCGLGHAQLDFSTATVLRALLD